jgi:hypothetical protein
MGSKALREIQLGQETVFGTPVTPTAVWRGLGVLDDIREIVVPDEDVGMLTRPMRGYIPKYDAALAMDSVEATYEQLIYILSGGIKEITPAADGGGSDYIWDFPFPTTAAQAPQAFTIRAGDDTEVEEMEYGIVRSFTLEGAWGEAWKISAEWFGRQVTGGKAFESLSLVTVEEMLFSKTALYIDDNDGAFGGTAVAGILRKATLNVTTGFIPLPVAGNLYFGEYGVVAPEITLDLEMEWKASTVTEKGNYRDEVERLVRLETEGSDFGTGGTTYSAHTLLVDVPGIWTRFEPLDSADGNDIVTANFRGGYLPTPATAGGITVVNEVATLV